MVDGYASKMDYPLNAPMLDYAAERFQYLYERYLGEAENIYLSIVPDKNYFLAKENGYLSLDYEELIASMQEKLPYMEYIYLTSETLNKCVVTSFDSGKPVEIPLYDMEKAVGKDPYEMFLSGTRAVLTIENPEAETERELIVFRDSFGSSLIPLLAQGYRKITVLDIRYVQNSQLGQLVEFGSQDVLFLYSTMLLNNSKALR